MSLAGATDPKPEIEAECAESHHCHPLKVKFDGCTSRVEGGAGAEGETCVEEFFDLMECVNHCVSLVMFKVKGCSKAMAIVKIKFFIFLTECYLSYKRDLDSLVSDSDLWNAFSHYNELVGARVVWDPVTNKSRGYGFVSFSSQSVAERVLKEMQRKKINDREIRLNWAVRKVSQKTTASYENISHRTSANNSTVYIGNIPDSPTIYNQLTDLLSEFGLVINLQVLNKFAFAKMDSHHSATLAILNLNGTIIDGQTLKFSWGKERYDWGNIMAQPIMIPFPIIYNNMAMYPFPQMLPQMPMYQTDQIQANDENKENL